MIKSLNIKNFKSHKDTNLEFSPGVNAITGISDSGKTNILRSMRWVKDNRPLGDGLIHNGQKEAEVSMSVIGKPGAVTISRVRSKSKNEYHISGESEPFTAFGESVPKPITEALNVSSINFQNQFQPYFLIFDSPGQVATHFRSITHLDEIDKIIDLIDSKLRKSKIGIQSIQSEINEVNAKLDNLSKVDLKLLELYIDEASQIIERQSNLELSSNKLSMVINELKYIEDHPIVIPDDIESIINESREIIDANSKLNKSSHDLSSLISLLHRINDNQISIPTNIKDLISSFSNLLAKSESLSNTQSKLKGLINQLMEIDNNRIVLPTEIDGTMANGKTLIEEYNKNVKDMNILFDIISKLDTIDSSLVEIDDGIGILEIEKSEIIDNIDTCPECGIEFTNESKQHFLNRNLK